MKRRHGMNVGPAAYGFRVGDRVTLDETFRRRNPIMALVSTGTVVGGSHDGQYIIVRRDGRKTREPWNPEYWTKLTTDAGPARSGRASPNGGEK